MADVAALHAALVDALLRRGAITDPRVEAAFRAIPRHLFLPDVPLAEVYRDQAIPTKIRDGEAISSSSQPEIMATMLDQLRLAPGLSVLEIGAGTGYNAALMAHIVGEKGAVVTMDVDDDLVESARAHLRAAGASRAQLIHGDGGLGHPAGAPYDRIILTVGAWDVAPAWWAQLRLGGRLVLPLAVGGAQKSVAFVHDGDHLVSASVKDCAFMRLRGAFAGPAMRVELGDTPGLHLYVRDPAGIDPAAAYALLRSVPADLPTGIDVLVREVAGGLVLWIALREPGFCWLEALGANADDQPVPELYAVPGKYRSACGVFERASAGFYMRATGRPISGGTGEPRPFELYVRSVGQDVEIGQRLLEHARAWSAAGRPGSDGLRIRVLPIDAAYTLAPHEQVIEKRWTRLVLDWPDQVAPGEEKPR